MDFRLTEDQRAYHDALTAFVDKVILPRASEVEAAKAFPSENYRDLAEFGYNGMVHEERYGGTDVDGVTSVLAQAELARACASTFLSVGASIGLFGLPLRLFGSEEMKSEIIPGLVRGELIAAWALTEPHCGTDAAAMKTTARRTDTGWVLNGSKMFITNGGDADWVMVAARSDEDSGHHGISNFLVKKGTPGFVSSQPLEKMGLRGSPTNGLFFEDCRIPDEWLVGEEGAGFFQAMKALENGRLGMAAFGVGIAQACLDESLNYAREREAFGKPIIRFQPVHFKLADMKIAVDGARLLMLRAAWLQERGECPQAVCSAAKLYATEAAVRCSDMAVQIHGGAGYMCESRVERLYRDARLGPIGEGTSEIQRRLIADETLALFS
ncbi:MAG: acyl-CoA dehydrogenase family protein [Myxococcota bacterium]|nr:acyl-CoA dehydrogenase family protein [Myxococcota bacterium]